jgi:hypothetical protein
MEMARQLPQTDPSLVVKPSPFLNTPRPQNVIKMKPKTFDAGVPNSRDWTSTLQPKPFQNVEQPGDLLELLRPSRPARSE